MNITIEATKLEFSSRSRRLRISKSTIRSGWL